MPRPYSGLTVNAGPALSRLPVREPTLYADASGRSSINGAEIFFATGVEASGYARPSVASLRDGIKTVNGASGQVLASTPTSNGQQIRVISEVFAKRTDVVGDAAWFLLRAVYLNVSGTLTVVSAPSVLSTGSVGGASGWTAVLAPSGSSVQTLVQGEAGKTVHWAVIREQVEVR